jgi:hypothetical protein
MSDDLNMRFKRGLKMGKLEQTIAIPVWTVVHTSVLE